MERPTILHMFTPGKQMSPFDVNMAADAGYDMLPPYCEVGLDSVAALICRDYPLNNCRASM